MPKIASFLFEELELSEKDSNHRDDDSEKNHKEDKHEEEEEGIYDDNE